MAANISSAARRGKGNRFTCTSGYNLATSTTGNHPKLCPASTLLPHLLGVSKLWVVLRPTNSPARISGDSSLRAHSSHLLMDTSRSAKRRASSAKSLSFILLNCQVRILKGLSAAPAAQYLAPCLSPSSFRPCRPQTVSEIRYAFASLHHCVVRARIMEGTERTHL